MSPLQVVTIYGICFAVAIYLAVSAGVRLRGSKSSVDFIMLCVSLAFWLLCNSFFFTIEDESIALFLNEIKFIGVSFASVFLFRFTAKFLHIRRLQSANLLIVLCVIPFITSILAISNPIHGLFRASIQIVYNPYRAVVVQNGAWYLVHTAYSYALIVASAALVALNIRKTPAMYRPPQYVVLFGMISTMAANLLVILSPQRPQLDVTPVSMSGALLFLYWAMGNSRVTDYLNVAREEIYNTMATGVFVLDNERVVVDTNRTAREWSMAVGVRQIIGNNFDELVADVLSRSGGEFIEGRWDNERDILLDIGDRRSIYSMAEHPLREKSGLTIGSYVSINDDTQARLLIDRLEYSAGVDPLTGLSNRRLYEKKLEELDGPEHLPLSIIMGDVNNLKIVNDRYGHDEGDKMLCAIARLLEGSAPQGGFVARIGGDEFVMLLPHCDENAARGVIERVRRNATLHRGTRATPNIALGSATKVYQGEEIALLIQEADAAMYTDKRNDRRRRSEEA